MKRLSKVLFFALPLIIASSFFIPFEPIWNYIKLLSSDGEIKSGTYEYYKSLFEKGRVVLMLLSFLPSIYLLCFDVISRSLNKFKALLYEKIKIINDHLSINVIFIFAFIISIAFIIAAVFLFDIGQDPAYYLNDIQNIEKFGHITRDYDVGGTHIYLIPNLPFNALSFLYVKLFGFSVVGIRFIIVLFTLLFIYSLYIFLEKDIFKYSFILIFSIPGIYSLTSEIFLEISAICFIIFSLFFLNKYEIQKKKKFEYYSLLFMSLAFTTKFQLIVYLFLVFTIMIIYESDFQRKRFLLFYLIKTYFLIFLIVIVTILPFGFNEMLIYINWYFISNTSEGRDLLVNSDIRLFMVNEILFLPLFALVVYLYYKFSNDFKKFLSFHFISIFSLINVIYWLLFFSSVTWRNIIYANIFLYIMLSTVLVKNKSYAKIVLMTFFLLGVSTNFIFIHHGVVDDVQFLKEHFKAIIFERDNSQKTFFEETSKKIEPNANVYVPALPYLSRVYLNNRRIILLKDFENSHKNKSYLIYDKDAFSENEFVRVKEMEIRGDYKAILNIGDYYLYKIMKQ